MHRERKSQNFIGYCPRKVYWKILHCKLWWISTNALTHVQRHNHFFLFSRLSVHLRRLLLSLLSLLYVIVDAAVVVVVVVVVVNIIISSSGYLSAHFSRSSHCHGSKILHTPRQRSPHSQIRFKSFLKVG